MVRLVAAASAAAACLVMVAGCDSEDASKAGGHSGPSEVQRQELLEELPIWIYVPRDDVSGFSLDSPIPVHQECCGFFRADDADLGGRLEPRDWQVMLPIHRDGHVAGMLVATDSLHGDYWYTDEVLTARCAKEVLGQPKGSRILHDPIPARGLFYAVRGDEVVPFQECGWEPWDVTTLAEYRRRVQEETPTLPVPRSVKLLIIGLVAVFIAVPVLVFRRRREAE